MTKLKHYILLREFASDLIRDISVESDPAFFLYAPYIDGYIRGLIEAFGLDKSEASNIRTEANKIKNTVREKVIQVQEVNKYKEALEYCKERLSKTAGVNKVLHSASTSEVIHLYETGWHSTDTCDFYDAYELLEAKYLKKEE